MVATPYRARQRHRRVRWAMAPHQGLVTGSLSTGVAHGRVGISQVTGPSVANMPRSTTPPDRRRLTLAATPLLPSRTLKPLGFRQDLISGLHSPAYSLACLRIDAVVAFDAARLATDLPVTLWSGETCTRWTAN